MKPPRFMLDTDTFSYLVSGRKPEVRDSAAKHEGEMALSAITLAEALYGARKRRSAKLESLIGLFGEVFKVVEWTPEAASAYADVRIALEEQGLPIGELDMMIAAAALAGGYTLVTNNTRHFKRIEGLAVENWVATAKRHSPTTSKTGRQPND